jgi:hypothetical protein
MTQVLPHATNRRATIFAAVVFAFAYLGALVFIFAPDGMLSDHAPVAQALP